jgi:Protein of unknown function (DUF2851)
MKEDFLQFVWKYKLYNTDNLVTTNGDTLEVLKPGFQNLDSGPDFIDARINMNDTLWAGNVEVHIKSSDWKAHNHETDKAYNNVILHVVLEHDVEVHTSSKRNLPTFILKFDSKLFVNYNKLIFAQSTISCSNKLSQVNEFKLTHWFERVLINRLERKSRDFLHQLKDKNNSWEEAFYIQMAKNFGFKTNALPFEMLARATPLTILAKHKNSLFQIEALLFGQAGFLEDNYEEEYFQKLKKEYLFLKNKYQLKPIDLHLWKFLRLRPANFPTIRIAQFSYLVHNSYGLFSKIVESKSIEHLISLFDIKPSVYWENHYKFNEESKKRIKRFGNSSVKNVLINSVVPVLFVYGEEKGDEKYKDRAFKILESLPAEKNNIVSKWSDLSIEIKNALDSQASIELYNEYCKPQKCLHCEIGREVITKYE